MARIRGGLIENVSGKIGPIVVVQRGDRSYVRMAPSYNKNSWSPNQKMHRERFRKVNLFCTMHKKSIILSVWNKISDKKSGYHLFLKANMPAFGLDGEIADISRLHFSDGNLPLPYVLKAEKMSDEPQNFKIRWQNDNLIQTRFINDELMYVVAYQNSFSGINETGILRKHTEGIITMSVKTENVKAIYLFFAAPDRSAFSKDCYFQLQ